MPAWAPINIYRLSSWVRSTCIPLLVISHHKPVFPLPNGRSASNDYLDELWYNAQEKKVPYTKPLSELLQTDVLSWSFAAIDSVICCFNGLRLLFTRGPARRKCVGWILEHQEPEGDWAGIFPPMHLNILALILEGYSVDDKCVKHGLDAIERFAWKDREGKRIQTCISPLWDTVLMTIGLCDAGVPISDERLNKAMKWVESRQIVGPEGDWRIYCSGSKSGGFAFEYFNRWYPDLDDTAAATLAFLKQDPDSGGSQCVLSAVEWMLDMQNLDGGWVSSFLSLTCYWFFKSMGLTACIGSF